MKIYKTFFSLKDEETWINEVQNKGYKLIKVSKIFPPILFKYKFERTKDKSNKVCLDYKRFKKSSDYKSYISLFKDSGWKHVSGSRGSGIHYFQTYTNNDKKEIFSDKESRNNFVQSYIKYSIGMSVYCIAFLLNFFIFNSISLNKMKDDYSWGFIALILLSLITAVIFIQAIFYLIKAFKIKKE
ncbi:DUF2812 domain-containing protein [Apilactobacillus xinyiensis]|uniref:DUF2812 domain-containing protein n=1 Tax=Apilactobacillus xinyiensis TaxID=2841032 RepID=UPI00200D6648|nr:DUF2812 domain-containing protein [Apilactobacillus xinyiensis]MCL0330679.1 DUF2812 domain-containing protein [Apilactobacillus xinyiensis]